MDNRDAEHDREAAQECAFASSGAYEWLLDQFAQIDRKYGFACARPASLTADLPDDDSSETR